MIRRMALRMKLQKTGGTIVHQTALMINLLRIKGFKPRMVTGFVANGPGEVCWHCWAVTDTGERHDIIPYMIADLCEMEYFSEMPAGYKRAEVGDDQAKYVLDENERLFELYHKDEKEFWKEAPVKVRKFSVVL